jgi:RNA polymerase sigma factor for flagellar operon FliA
MSASASLEESWAEFIKTRQPRARDWLITSYIPFVRFVVTRLGIPTTGGLLDIEDLVSYGIIGLINAIDRYDPARGVRFEAFATPRIRGAVIDQLRSLNWLPRSVLARVRQMEGALANLEQRLGRFASEREAAAEMGVTPQRYRQMMLDGNAIVLSLDAPLGPSVQDDEVVALSDLLEERNLPSPDEYAEKRELFHVLLAALQHLPERERLVLTLYYHKELTMKEISKLLAVSESRVCQLHTQALTHLRTNLYPYQQGVPETSAPANITLWQKRARRRRAHATLTSQERTLILRRQTSSQKRVS